MCCNFHGMVQCYGQMLNIAVTSYSNLLHLVTSSQTVLVIRRSLRQRNITVLCYISVSTFMAHGLRILESLHNEMLTLEHKSYMSWDRIIWCMLINLWWPRICKDINRMAESCTYCAKWCPNRRERLIKHRQW